MDEGLNEYSNIRYWEKNIEIEVISNIFRILYKIN